MDLLWTEDPKSLRAALISVVTAIGDTPAGALLCRRALCAMVAPEPSPPVTPPQADALSEIAEHLGLAAAHAEFLAEQARRVTAGSPHPAPPGPRP